MTTDSECMCNYTAEQVAEELKRRFAEAGISKGDPNTPEMRASMLWIADVLYLEWRGGFTRARAEEIAGGWRKP